MANYRIKAASLLVGGKKIGQFETNQYTVNTGDEAQFGDGGYAGHSDGAGTTSISATGFVPVQGMDFDFESAMNAKQYLSIIVEPINGGLRSITMRCVKAEITSNHRNGEQKGTFNFEGGPATIVKVG